MADLDFSHNVSEIPAGQNVPQPYRRTVSAEVTAFPDMQSAITNYANNTNWMSSIGSFVAGRASNAIAQRIGGELGKNPQGDIGIPLTDFDKTMQESYKTQAQATLGLQANKLINDSNLEAAKADRITPELIAKTNKSISLGLKNIFKNAPSEVVPHLEYQYGNLQMSQVSDLTERMIREQKQDRIDNTSLAIQKNSENAYSFGFKGDSKTGLAVVENTKRLVEADVAAHLMKPEEAKSKIDTARQSYLNGKIAYDYEQAKKNNEGEKFLKDLADGKIIKLDNPDYMPVSQNLMNYINHQDSLRSQNQQLYLAKFNVAVAQNPLSPDIASQLQDLKNNVSPVEFEKAHLSYIKALKSVQKETLDTNAALAAWGDPSAFERMSEKSKNKAFDIQTVNYRQQREKEGNPVSQEEAEVHVAAIAGGKVPVFIKSIDNKFASPNPANIDSAARQVELLNKMGLGNVTQSLSADSRAMFTKYQAIRDSMDPVKAAQEAHDVVYNKGQDTYELNAKKWTNFIHNTKPQGQDNDVFALNQVGFSPSQMRSPSVYGNDIFNEYETYFKMLNGDQLGAKKMLQDSVEQNYGETHINGVKEITKHPIEKVLNLPPDAVGVVQQDIIEQLDKQFNSSKKYYTGYTDDKGNKVKPSTNEYWEVIPRYNTQDLMNHRNQFQKSLPSQREESIRMIKQFGGTDTFEKFNRGDSIEVVKHMRGGKSQKYNVVVQMNPFARATGNPDNPVQGGWDISVDSGSGPLLLVREAPYLGIVNYNPNVKKIKENYYSLKPLK